VRILSSSADFVSQCPLIISFAHHRVSVPPSGWVSAAHRQGVKILGTLYDQPPRLFFLLRIVLLARIFESSDDLLQLITGPLPQAQDVSIKSPQPSGSIALSSHYACLLAELAYQRGFDGYLLNFESYLSPGIEKAQSRALASWITILQSKLQDRIGAHAQAVWFDLFNLNT
jgi:mannosyl-glycoprotein endo-beta-N-acetylglucosaminidase